jgi:hypothetical protein
LKRTFNEVAGEHFYPLWALLSTLEGIRRNHGEVFKPARFVLGKDVRSLLPLTVIPNSFIMSVLRSSMMIFPRRAAGDWIGDGHMESPSRARMMGEKPAKNSRE